MTADVIVVATRTANPVLGFSGDFEIAIGGFGAVYVPFFGTVEEAAAGTARRDYKAPATDKAPEVTVVDATAAEFATVMAGVINSDKDAEFAASLLLAKNTPGVSLKVTFVDVRGPEFQNSDAFATYRFPKQVDFSGNESFRPGGTIEIFVHRPSLNNSADPRSALSVVLAHEFSHMTVNAATGKFYTDFAGPNDAYVRETSMHEHLYTGFVSSNFSQSLDVQLAVSGGGGTADFIGTAGNNLMEDGGYSNSVYHTYGGNDIIRSGGSGWDLDLIIADGGTKLIQDFGPGFEIVEWHLANTGADIALSLIGADLFVTIAGSAYAPHLDPNKLVIMDWLYDPLSSIEGIKTNDGQYYSLSDKYPVVAGGARESGAARIAAAPEGPTSLTAEQSAQVQAMFGIIEWWAGTSQEQVEKTFTVGDPGSGRYERVLSYSTISLDAESSSPRNTPSVDVGDDRATLNGWFAHSTALPIEPAYPDAYGNAVEGVMGLGVQLIL